ncbi:uncharacterized protein [Emydura macquarii macquarii]|uniref:uncharacterized protein n=1 Tax=Emydura macquarii macquarii TaxID=1129001 RepID=UPI00352A0B9E
MATAKPKRAPAWRRAEVLDHIRLWGENSVLAQLRASNRNLDIYGKISQGMLEKGHNRDAQQCRVKIKELWQTYQKAREANSCSGSSPKTCRFYGEVHAILGGNPTTMPPYSINTSTASQSVNNEEESLDEEEETVESREHESGVSVLPETQELFLTPEQSTSTPDSTSDPMEGTSDTSALDRPLRNAVDRLSQIRKRREKKTKNPEIMFSELMTASTSAETEQRTWKLTLSQSMDRVTDTHRQMQETDRSMTHEMLKLLQYQSDMLGRLVDLHEPRAMLPSPATTRSRRKLSRMQPVLSSTPASFHPTPGDSE